MKQPISKETAEARATRKFSKLYAPLVDLVDALQNLEPGGTLVDDIFISRDRKGDVRMEYIARPIALTIKSDERTMILRVIEAGE
jgi:hypothetical protein